MEVAGDWPGATKENTVCLLHKCLEGLRQAGNIWQTTHSGWLNGLKLALHFCTIFQSIVEPTLFVGHCSKGIIAILVWVDDIWVAFSKGTDDYTITVGLLASTSISETGMSAHEQHAMPLVGSSA